MRGAAALTYARDAAMMLWHIPNRIAIITTKADVDNFCPEGVEAGSKTKTRCLVLQNTVQIHILSSSSTHGSQRKKKFASRRLRDCTTLWSSRTPQKLLGTALSLSVEPIAQITVDVQCRVTLELRAQRNKRSACAAALSMCWCAAASTRTSDSVSLSLWDEYVSSLARWTGLPILLRRLGKDDICG